MPETGLEERVARLEGRVEGFEDRFSLDHRLSSRIEALDSKISRNFIWTVGIQVAVLLAVVGALAGR